MSEWSMKAPWHRPQVWVMRLLSVALPYSIPDTKCVHSFWQGSTRCSKFSVGNLNVSCLSSAFCGETK